MAGQDFPAPSEGFVLTHFIVAADVARSRDFYVGVLGGTVVLDGEPTIVKLAKGSRGAEFLTPPKDHGREVRCYMRDPDGHLIEVGQTTGGPRGG